MEHINQNLKKNNKTKFPKIMGVLNITPDSFSDGGDFIDFSSAIDFASEMIDYGVDIIDIGGESTRPGAEVIDDETELKRVEPIVKEVRKLNNEVKISLDSTKYKVVQRCLDLGINIINDISGTQNDIRLLELAKLYKSGYVIMHSKGTPKTMQLNPTYENVVNEVYNFLEEKTNLAKSYNINEIYVDVGIGFGKSLEHNLELINNIEIFKKIGETLLGISRKSFINKLLNIENPKNRDLPTLLIHTLLLNKNIDVIRVHNVKEYRTLKTLYEYID